MSFLYPVASADCLSIVFNTAHEDSDAMLLYPLDMKKQKGLMDRFGVGKLVSFEIDGGQIKTLNDMDVNHLGASMYFVKDVTCKHFSELTESEARMINVVNGAFYQQWKDEGIHSIKTNKVVTLIRFNLGNALHFFKPPEPSPALKTLH